MIATTLEQEQQEQQRWALHSQRGKVNYFDVLLRNEFETPSRWRERVNVTLSCVIRFACTQVPYYRRQLSERGLSLQDVLKYDGLQRLGVLSKQAVRDHREQLRPSHLPPGESWAGVTRTSGTTGQPVEVDRTFRSGAMFGLLKQREYRWFRFDPRGTMAMIRCGDEMPPKPDGSPCAGDETLRLAGWPLVGYYFQTGPAVGFDHTNPVDAHAQWLQRQNPHYLLTEAGDLECLAFGFQQADVPSNLKGIVAISHQLTPQMRRLAERVFKVPIHQNYGLNEIGIVASRCSAGRYHVHGENCLIEIVDENDQPCAPGETGRLLITSLSNLAMPLLRYDADDLAVVADGPCPCGRTLPSFAEIIGRYRRLAHLPQGTWAIWQAFRVAIERMPPELSAPLRQYQLHQHRDGRFELRVVAAQLLAPAFGEYLQAAWRAGPAGDAVPLRIAELDRIPPGPGHKLQNFTSDFVPDSDAQAAPPALPPTGRIPRIPGGVG
jgi:phenylacetate-CoA ligase